VGEKRGEDEEEEGEVVVVHDEEVKRRLGCTCPEHPAFELPSIGTHSSE
jgi:hypothetical protein